VFGSSTVSGNQLGRPLSNPTFVQNSWSISLSILEAIHQKCNEFLECLYRGGVCLTTPARRRLHEELHREVVPPTAVPPRPPPTAAADIVNAMNGIDLKELHREAVPSPAVPPRPPPAAAAADIVNAMNGIDLNTQHPVPYQLQFLGPDGRVIIMVKRGGVHFILDVQLTQANSVALRAASSKNNLPVFDGKLMRFEFAVDGNGCLVHCRDIEGLNLVQPMRI
jgi:hypothetical protein